MTKKDLLAIGIDASLPVGDVELGARSRRIAEALTERRELCDTLRAFAHDDGETPVQTLRRVLELAFGDRQAVRSYLQHAPRSGDRPTEPPGAGE